MTTKNNKLFITGFIMPCVIVLLLIYIYPVLRTIAMSFFHMNGVTKPISEWTFGGLDNYKKLFQSPDFLKSLWNSFKYLIMGGIFTVVLSILLGVFLSAKQDMPGRNFFRTIIYMPNMLSAIAIGNAFTYFVFQEDFGLLTTIWKFFGAEPIAWMTSTNKFNSMLFAVIFCGVGYYMLLMISGIESIPDDLYEAAVLDGAGPFAKFWHVTLPLMKGTIRTIVTFWSIGAMQSFAWNQAFSPLGAESSTISPIVYMYEILFGSALAQIEPDAGLGAAVGITTAVMVQIIYTICNKALASNDLEF